MTVVALARTSGGRFVAKPKVFASREQWLHAAAEKMRPWFQTAGKPLPEKLHMSMGFGKNLRKHLGTCWQPEVSEDKVHQIFVSPVHHADWTILSTLLHELCHAALPWGTGHKKPFAQLARAVGLVGPWRATTASPELIVKLVAMAAELGPVPHSKMNLGMGGLLKQPTRMKLWECECEKPIKIRAAVEINCTCNECGALFQRKDA